MFVAVSYQRTCIALALASNILIQCVEKFSYYSIFIIDKRFVTS